MVKIEKKVTFDLTSDSGEILLPNLIEEGHVRAHVLSLFKTLEEQNFGEFKPGTRGRGQSSRFIKNENCPDEFDLCLIEKKKGRRRNVDKTASDSLDALAQEINSGELVKSNSIEGIETNCQSQDNSQDNLQEEKNRCCLAELLADTDLTDLASDLSVVNNTEIQAIPTEEAPEDRKSDEGRGARRERDLFKVVLV